MVQHLNGVVDGAHTAREPQAQGGVHCHIGVVDDYFGAEGGMGDADFVAVFGGVACHLCCLYVK